jgi:hypothetical protein
VRGFGTMVFQCRGNVFNHSVDIFHYIVVPITKNEVSHCFENLCSLRVSVGLGCVLTAVEFDDQVSIGAKEIDDEAIDGTLTPKFPSAETAITQAKPKYAFYVRLITA